MTETAQTQPADVQTAQCLMCGNLHVYQNSPDELSECECGNSDFMPPADVVRLAHDGLDAKHTESTFSPARYLFQQFGSIFSIFAATFAGMALSNSTVITETSAGFAVNGFDGAWWVATGAFVVAMILQVKLLTHNKTTGRNYD